MHVWQTCRIAQELWKQVYDMLATPIPMLLGEILPNLKLDHPLKHHIKLIYMFWWQLKNHSKSLAPWLAPIVLGKQIDFTGLSLMKNWQWNSDIMPKILKSVGFIFTTSRYWPSLNEPVMLTYSTLPIGPDITYFGSNVLTTFPISSHVPVSLTLMYS